MLRFSQDLGKRKPKQIKTEGFHGFTSSLLRDVKEMNELTGMLNFPASVMDFHDIRFEPRSFQIFVFTAFSLTNFESILDWQRQAYNQKKKKKKLLWCMRPAAAKGPPALQA